MPFSPVNLKRGVGTSVEGVLHRSLDGRAENRALRNATELDLALQGHLADAANYHLSDMALIGPLPAAPPGDPRQAIFAHTQPLRRSGSELRYQFNQHAGSGQLLISLGGNSLGDNQQITIPLQRPLARSEVANISTLLNRSLSDAMRLMTHYGLMRGATFQNIELTGGHLELVDLRGARFQNCTFKDVNLNGAILNDTHWSNCKFLARIELLGVGKCSIRGALIRNAEFLGCDFSGADLRGSLVDHSTLDPGSSNMRKADIRGTVFLDGSMLRFLVDNQNNISALRDRMRGMDLHSKTTKFFLHGDPDDANIGTLMGVNQKSEAIRANETFTKLLTKLLIRKTRYLPEQLTEAQLGAALKNSAAVRSYELGQRPSSDVRDFSIDKRFMAITKTRALGGVETLHFDFSPGARGEVGLCVFDQNGHKVANAPINNMRRRVVSAEIALRKAAEWLIE